jgi:APA family basic amino acid/polyamine antiporter
MDDPIKAPSADVSPARLKRVLNYWDAAALGIGIVIGSGIFAVPPSIAASLDTFPAMISVWLAGGLIALCGALTYAEISAMFPRAGGAYVFLYETYGRFPAFAYGWSALFITYPASMAAVAVVFSQYLARFIPLSPVGQSAVAAGLCLLVAAINIIGVKVGAGVQRTLTAAKVLAISAIPIFGFMLLKGDFARLGGNLAPTGGFSLTAVALAMVAVMWTFEGWADIPTIAEEVQDKKRDVPRALILCAIGVTAIYLAVNAAYVYLLGIDGVAGSQSVASDAGRAVFGQAGDLWITILVLASTAGSLNGMVIGGSRVFFALARDGMFLAPVGRVHPRFNTPANSLAILGVIGATYTLLGTFEEIIRYFVFVATIWFLLNIAAVFVLRRKRPDLERPFKVPLYPLTPLIFLAMVAGLMIQLYRDNTHDANMGLLLMLAAVPIYFLWRKRHRSAGGDTEIS